MFTPPPAHRLSRRTVLRSLAATGAVAAAGGLAACGGSGSSSAGTLRILVLKHPLTKPMAQMAWTAQLEEIAGMPITWEEV